MVVSGIHKIARLSDHDGTCGPVDRLRAFTFHLATSPKQWHGQLSGFQLLESVRFQSESTLALLGDLSPILMRATMKKSTV